MLIPTAFGEDKLFVEVSEPYEFKEYVAAAASEFQIIAGENIVASVFGVKLKSEQFRTIVVQYINTPTFQIDLTIGYSVRSVATASTVSGTLRSDESFISSESDNLTSPYIISITIPDVDSIKSLKIVKNIWKNFLLGIPLQNKHRVNISKAIIDECLKDNPARIIKRDEFQALADSIVSVFDTEIASAYFIPSGNGCIARGKLWSAYNNKRATLSANGIINRRPKTDLKRKLNSSPIESVAESIQYLHQNTSEWSTITCKWTETHSFRRSELKGNISTYEYISKYPALHGNKGVELVSIDVHILYAPSETVESWLTLYSKVLNQARKLRDSKVCHLINEIDQSSNERLKAQLSFLLIPYILPHSGKRSEQKLGNANKYEIQQRFIKEYKTMTELREDAESADVQIKFVNDTAAITYAEFIIAGYSFKCSDLLEAVNIGFMYIMALDVTYPKLVKHVWQFIQLSIFKIQLHDVKVPNIESIVKDLFAEA